MYTFGQYVEDEKKDAKALGEARGVARGEARGVVQGRKQLLLEFIRQVWGDAEADWCARTLETAELHDLPDIADLMADQAAGRPPRLETSGHAQPRV